MSDTPRTDAALSKVGYCTEDACQDWTPLLELCRSLERELALAVDNAVAQMEKAGERSFPPEVTYTPEQADRRINELHEEIKRMAWIRDGSPRLISPPQGETG